MNIDSGQSGWDLFKPSAPGEDKKWYETSNGHRFAGEVLQLPIRRKIMKYIGSGIKSKEEIERNFGLNEAAVELHLGLLERAVVIEKIENGYRSTPIGIAYQKNFEDFASETSKDHFNG
ncbi:MAG: hypothetical protein PHY05_13820 [Methanothrix sp.]|nr:hypothetical protein [Methanothrix sp.]